MTSVKINKHQQLELSFHFTPTHCCFALLMTGNLTDRLALLFKRKHEEEMLWPAISPSEEVYPVQHLRKDETERKHRGSVDNSLHRSQFLSTASSVLPPTEDVQFEQLSQTIFTMLDEPQHSPPNNISCTSYRNNGFRTKYRSK